MTFRTLHDQNTHFGWDNRLEPALRVAPGERLEFRAQDAAAGQLTQSSTHQDVSRLNQLAYCLCSVAGDLSVSELVDAPNWVVSMSVPTSVFS